MDNPNRQILVCSDGFRKSHNIRDVTYGVSAYQKGDLHLFDGEFTTKDGILVFSFEYENTDIVTKNRKRLVVFSRIF